jgi:aldose 1-epimerase
MPTPSFDRMTDAPFGRLPDGRVVRLFSLRNRSGMSLGLLDYGGIIVSIHAPDREGRFDDVVLGFDGLQDYVERSPFFGATIGRYGNRIARGQFTLDGHTYTLAINNPPNHLHGGPRGWDKVIWDAKATEDSTSSSVRLRYTSKAGEEGYPGTVKVEVSYALTDDNEVRVGCRATTDAPTVINVTNHSYFNLGGSTASSIVDHELQLFADRFTPVDRTLIPTGELAPVAGTPFDFTTPTRIGARIDADDPQLHFGEGYDHNFVVRRSAPGLVPFARVVDPHTGRTLEVQSTEPGVQFYTGNHLPLTLVGKGGRTYTKRSGFCLETQHFPDSPNQPGFPPTTLRPDETYEWTTVFRFGTA